MTGEKKSRKKLELEYDGILAQLYSEDYKMDHETFIKLRQRYPYQLVNSSLPSDIMAPTDEYLITKLPLFYTIEEQSLIEDDYYQGSAANSKMYSSIIGRPLNWRIGAVQDR